MADRLQEILDEIETKKAATGGVITEVAVEPELPEPEQGGDVIHVLPVLPDYDGETIAQTGGITAFVRAVMPLRSDKPLEIVRKIVFMVSLMVAIVCFGMIFNNIRSGAADEANYNNLRQGMERALEQFEMSGSLSLPSDKIEEMLADDPAALLEYAHELAEFIPLSPERILEILMERPGIKPQYIETYDRNNDLIGWLRIQDTRLDYPVLQYRRYGEDGRVTGDNHYYLDYDIDHIRSAYGSIYAEWRFPFTPTYRPDNTVLYGHNMRNRSRFHTVSLYYPYHHNYPRPSIEFYRENPIIEFNTLYTEGLYKVFAVIFVHTEEDKYEDVYDYFRKREFPDRASFYDFMQNIMDRSAFYTDVDVMYGDEILTLSTCHYPLGESVDARVAVFARRLREGETIDDFDLDAAYVNSSPLFFNLFYERRGGMWQGRNWDTSKIIGLDEFLLENPDADTRLNYITRMVDF
ncbi:MAG: class B sortase [Oscillospiraceae bacterium]|jgi:SrtB family sortase|nr:class B sortase [Oscillospiraceae bacterium]